MHFTLDCSGYNQIVHWTYRLCAHLSRFSAEAKAQRDPIYFMPFSAGPRNCIGMRLAQLEIRIAAIKILQKFNVRPCDKTQVIEKTRAPFHKDS